MPAKRVPVSACCDGWQRVTDLRRLAGYAVDTDRTETIMTSPMFHGPVLLSPGDGVATTRITYDHAGNPSGFVPATFVGYVLSFPDRIPGSDMWSVTLDSGVTEFRTTQTLAIWPPANSGARP